MYFKKTDKLSLLDVMVDYMKALIKLKTGSLLTIYP